MVFSFLFKKNLIVESKNAIVIIMKNLNELVVDGLVRSLRIIQDNKDGNFNIAKLNKSDG